MSVVFWPVLASLRTALFRERLLVVRIQAAFRGHLVRSCVSSSVATDVVHVGVGV